LKAGWRVWLRRVLWRAIIGFIAASFLLVLLLRWLPLPTSSVITQAWIKTLWADNRIALRYDWTPYERIAPSVAVAVIAAEDQRFPVHYGFDLIEIQNALEDQEEGKPVRGASTISQQVAKNLFLWSGRSVIRKGLEVWFTALLELLWPKQRILEVYLNIAEFGEATFGVEAASQRYFNKSALRLTAEQAARLAAVLPNPVRYRVDKPSSYVLKRQRWIQQQIEQLGGVAYLDKLSAGSSWSQNPKSALAIAPSVAGCCGRRGWLKNY
jgi:monofunctional biosynthetic peptidoglycan transglycosylase